MSFGGNNNGDGAQPFGNQWYANQQPFANQWYTNHGNGYVAG
jgi:hypothetical protein